MSSQSRDSDPAAVGQPVYVMYSSNQQDRVDLSHVAGLIWRRKWWVALSIALCAGGGVLYALLAAPIYRAEVVLVPNEPENPAGLASSLGGLGGLASLAGINFGASGDATESIATLRSRAFIEEFIRDNDLLPVLFADEWDAARGRWMSDDPEEQPDIRRGVRFFAEEVRTVNEDPVSGLVTLGIEWTDPELAARWAEELVYRINERLRARDLSNAERRLEYLNAQLENASLVELRQAISRLVENEIQTMTLAQAEAEYAFKTIDPPRVPDEPVAPRPLLVVALSIFFGGVIGVLAALLWPSARTGTDRH